MLQHVCRTVRVGVALLTAVLLQVSCVTGDVEEQPTSQPTMLNIYVYTPDSPVVTRADGDSMEEYEAASEGEDLIHSLHIWIFKHDSTADNTEPEGYFFADEEALKEEGQGDVFQVPVNDGFSSDKPTVDVYVMANVTEANCGLTLGENSTLGQVKASMITGKFGLEDRQTAVPADGLPMSGVLKNQHVVGDAPVLRIVPNTESDAMSKVKLERVVSKLSFVFSAQVGHELKITGVSIDGGVLPNQEYLFLEGLNYSYNESAVTLWPTTSEEPVVKPLAVNNCIDPTIYVYNSQESGAYESYADFIQAGIAEGDLTALNPQQFYLRESDKQVSGKITYTVDGGTKKTATFTCKAGGFSRNHYWIVYAYYDSLKEQMVTIVVQSAFTEWLPGGSAERTVHNW